MIAVLPLRVFADLDLRACFKSAPPNEIVLMGQIGAPTGTWATLDSHPSIPILLNKVERRSKRREKGKPVLQNHDVAFSRFLAGNPSRVGPSANRSQPLTPQSPNHNRGIKMLGKRQDQQVLGMPRARSSAYSLQCNPSPLAVVRGVGVTDLT